MRVARTKMKDKACYYHACSRIAGAKDDYLFTDVDIRLEKSNGLSGIVDVIWPN